MFKLSSYTFCKDVKALIIWVDGTNFFDLYSSNNITYTLKRNGISFNLLILFSCIGFSNTDQF